ncbi:MAG: peptidoglycan DD-metalloendopeptidase family protein [Ruminococcus sp.]|jgi:murein DD-endopeptidase MepM/ murein hydrolase activator NlpD|nr:peptidoglycan DD-metalloendopeptidase family protein [Ruminococcus sp.]
MKIKRILTVFVCFILLMSVCTGVNAADTMATLQEKQQQLNASIKENERLLADMGDSAKDTEKYLELYDEKMRAQEELLDSLNEQIRLLEADISAKEADIKKTEQAVVVGISKFKARIRAIYVSGNDSLASVLTGATSFYDILAALEFIERVAENDNAMIDDLNIQIEALEIQREDLNQNHADLENVIAEAETEKIRLKETYDGHAETLAMQQAMIEDYKDNAAELEQQQAAVEQEIEAFIKAEQERLAREEAERKAAEEAARKAALEAGKNFESDDSGKYTSYSDTGFIWPVPTVRNTSDGYGNRWIVEEQRNNFHKGLDITKPGCKGETIVASAGGTVIQASDSGNGYGKCVIIDHGNKISTLYAHMSKTAVSVGQVVEQGETLGYIGSTGNSYGNHLHFEVRVNGQHTDPTEYIGHGE